MTPTDGTRKGTEDKMADGLVRKGYILVKVGRARRGAGAEAIAAAALELPDVERVELVTGAFDLILHVRDEGERSEPSHLLTRVRAISGVLRALPCWVSAEAGQPSRPRAGRERSGPGTAAPSPS